MTKDNTFFMTLLLDFYGELLTDKQREYFDLYHNEDFSLTEIAEREGISKQGVSELISRGEKKLLDIEKKTGLMQKWIETRNTLEAALKDGAVLHPDVAAYFQL